MKYAFVIIALVLSPASFGQYIHHIQLTNGTTVTHPVTEIDSISFSVTGVPVMYLNTGRSNSITHILSSIEKVTLSGIPEIEYPSGSVHCIEGGSEVVEVLNTVTGHIWMDRNLGASQVAVAPDDAAAYGDLYQWGRFSDGHQCRNSNTTTILSTMDAPPHGDFIVALSAPSDWRIPQNNNLWQGVGGVNNPCPSGFRIPTDAEWNWERLSWISNDIEGAFSSPLKLTPAGRRYGHSGELNNVGSGGRYWSSTAIISARRLRFDANCASINYNVRSGGYSIRCIKDVEESQGSIQFLDCDLASNVGSLQIDMAVSGTFSTIPYTGGNGGSYSAQSVASTGVQGLMATLPSGVFANGNGSLIYIIGGTPLSSGEASFEVNIGGQVCALNRSVSSATTNYPAGTVICSGIPTAIVEVFNPITGNTWMDRNLGASQAADASETEAAFGDLYQWGRFSDGHQCRNSPDTAALSTTNYPTFSNFILAPISPSDWRNSQNDSLWQGAVGINNPCPFGYRIPTSAEWNAEGLSWSSNNKEGALQSALKLPGAGRRSALSGGIKNTGALGAYWSSSVSGSSARAVGFANNNAYMSSQSRANGFSVRCIKNIAAEEGSIQWLNCDSALNNGTLLTGILASGVSSVIAYSGGDGGTYFGQSITSEGVPGLTATLASGEFAYGNGVLVFTITGTPVLSGSASFTVNIGGQVCQFDRMVDAEAPAYPNGTMHCTATPTQIVEVANPATGKSWMDRNLGATQMAASSTDEPAYGDLYQWGRFGDGHQCRTSPVTTNLSITDTPTSGEFIIAPSSPGDWRNSQNNNLWQGGNGINNPCPSGFRIPTEAEWNEEISSWSNSSIEAAFLSPLRFAAAGRRYSHSGELGSVGLAGRYWSSTISGSLARRVRIDSGCTDMGSHNRASGFTVRCIKE